MLIQSPNPAASYFSISPRDHFLLPSARLSPSYITPVPLLQLFPRAGHRRFVLCNAHCVCRRDSVIEWAGDLSVEVLEKEMQPEKRAQRAKCLSCEHEDPSSDPQHPFKI